MNVLWLLSLLISSASLHAAVVVQGNDPNSPYGFLTPITVKAYDRMKGNFFVGLLADPITNQYGQYAISKAPRPTFNTPATFTGILGNTSTFMSMYLNITIDFLAVSEQTNQNSVLAVVSAANPLEIGGMFDDGTQEIPLQSLSTLNDANGSTIGSIVQITASPDYVFAMVAANGGSFGGSGTGIALVGIDTSTTSLAFNVKNAVTGINGNLAFPLDQSSVVVKGNEGGNNVIFVSSIANPPVVGMTWDSVFQRLYIGLQIQTGPNTTDIGKAVVVAQLSPSAIELFPIVADDAITPNIEEILVGQGANLQIGSAFPRIMHTSTGPDYLITTGLDYTMTLTFANRVFALPLVYDPTTPSVHGTLANVNSALNASYKFTDPAMNSGDLAVNNPITNAFAVVGGGDLPIQPDQSVSDLVVVGDCVYVALDESPSSDSDTGIFYSQALFADTGEIVRWTPWTKRGIPLNAFGTTTLPSGVVYDGRVRFLEVDGAAGNIWFVEGDTQQVTGITSWTNGVSMPLGLINQVSAALSSGCYCALDLDQATRGFLSTTANRYALFGGTNKVAFAYVSQAESSTTIASPQTVFTDYTNENNFLVTALPDNAGYCTCLEYSRTSTTAGDVNNLNYFFAGTPTGLYVYADQGGNGFNALNLASLISPPFSTSSWYGVSSISGSVVDLKTSGAGPLYVLTFQSTASNPLSSTLYSIPYQPTTAAMFASSNIYTIAQTGVGAFSSVIEFFGIQIVATGDPDSANPENDEQLVLATNQGLFTSNADQMIANGVASVTNQTNANWMLVNSGENTTATTMFNGIAGIDTPVRQTTWPISVEDPYGRGTFDHASIQQFSGNGTAAVNGSPPLFNSFFIPMDFNSNPQTPNLTTLYPITYFFSDGGRRFFLFNRQQDPPTIVRLGIIPYDIVAWSVTQPILINHPTLNAVNRFYWIKQIGSTGILMAGTGTGAVGLE